MCISLLSLFGIEIIEFLIYMVSVHVFIVLHGKVMRKVGVEVIGLGALKLTGFLRELMQQNNISFESLYTVRTLKEVCYNRLQLWMDAVSFLWFES